MKRTGTIALSLLVLAGAAACSDDDGDSVDTSDTSGSVDGGDGGTTTTAGGGAAGDTVEVTAVDYAFEGLPDSVAAGTTLSLTNSSTAEVHELVAFRLADDETRPLDELLALPEAEAAALFAGEPAMVLIAPPASPGFPVVGDGSLTEAGRYVVLCSIPIGADPEEFLAAAQTSDGPPDVAGGPPHFTEGMAGELTVEG